MTLLSDALNQSQGPASHPIQSIDSLFLSKIAGATDADERKRLEALYGSYKRLPADSKKGSIMAKEIVCQALDRKSYFDYAEGECPADKFF